MLTLSTPQAASEVSSMTKEEIRCVSKLLVGGCSVCARGHILRLACAFLEHRDMILEVWQAGLDKSERDYERTEMLADLAEFDEYGVVV